VIRELLFLLGKVWAIRAWDSDASLVCSLVVAVLLGMIFVKFANNNCVHNWLRTWGWYERIQAKGKCFKWLPNWEWTSRTSYPSEWFSTFTREKRWIVLHLMDGRRLYGWPEEWPDQPERGHFVMEQPEWLLPDGRRASLEQVSKLLVPSSKVEMIEFVKFADEITVDQKELDETAKILVSLHREGEKNGKQSSTTGSK
jgi:hypothetical protein